MFQNVYNVEKLRRTLDEEAFLFTLDLLNSPG